MYVLIIQEGWTHYVFRHR